MGPNLSVDTDASVQRVALARITGYFRSFGSS
jgi:hypothetical protein